MSIIFKHLKGLKTGMGESHEARVGYLPRKLWNHISESTEIGGNLLKMCLWHFLYYLVPAMLEAPALRPGY